MCVCVRACAVFSISKLALNPFRPFVVREAVKGPLSPCAFWSLLEWLGLVIFPVAGGGGALHRHICLCPESHTPLGRWSSCREGTGQGQGRPTLWTRAPWQVDPSWPLQLWNLLTLQLLLPSPSLLLGAGEGGLDPQEMPHFCQSNHLHSLSRFYSDPLGSCSPCFLFSKFISVRVEGRDEMLAITDLSTSFILLRK